MSAPGCSGRAPARRRAGAIAALTGVAVLLHAALLSEVRWGWPAPPAPFAALQVRAIGAPVPGGSEASAGSSERSHASDARTEDVVATALDGDQNIHAALLSANAKPPRRAVDARAVRLTKNLEPGARTVRPDVAAGPSPASAGAAETRPDMAVASAQAAIGDGSATETLVADSSASPGPARPSTDTESVPDPIPLYRTRLPPPATLRYALRVGDAAGTAELRWRPDGEAYGLRFEGRVDGGPTLTQVSDGGFDLAGLAPVRHTDARTRRGMLATNFQRDAGRISFSGSRTQLPLARGSQDRLSWMVQLASVLGAEPALREPGAVVSIPVAGLRGEAAVWRFRAVASEASADARLGPSLVRLLRDRQGPYDVDIEVVLDPAHHFLPASVSLRNANGVPALELALQDALFER